MEDGICHFRGDFQRRPHCLELRPLGEKGRSTWKSEGRHSSQRECKWNGPQAIAMSEIQEQHGGQTCQEH